MQKLENIDDFNDRTICFIDIRCPSILTKEIEYNIMKKKLKKTSTRGEKMEQERKDRINKVYNAVIKRVLSKIDVMMFNPQKIENLSQLEENSIEYNRLVKELFIFNLPKLTINKKIGERIDELLDAMSEYFEYPTENKKKVLEEKREFLKNCSPCVCLGWDKKRKETIFEGYKFHVSGE